MTEKAPNQFRQWRRPSEQRIEREDELAEQLHESICADLAKTKTLLEKINIIPHGGRHGSIDLKVSNDILVEAGEISEMEYDPSDPHEETTLSFSYFTQSHEIQSTDGETHEEVFHIYEVGTTTSLPTSFTALPQDLHIEALEALDGSFDGDESSPDEIHETLNFYDDPQTAFRVYQDLVVTYEIDPRLADIQYRYEMSYSLYQNDERVATLYGESYSSDEGSGRTYLVHDPSIDEHGREVVTAPDVTFEHENLEPGEYILTTEEFDELVSTEEARGTGLLSGLSTLQGMKNVQKLVKALPR